MLRVYLSGQIVLDADGVLLESRDFPGQQGREAFAYLATNRAVPVPRSELAEALWGERLPDSWDTALSSIVSKLRSLLARAGCDGTATLRTVGGCYELHLPGETWIDHEVALDSIHQAESALGLQDFPGAYGPSAVAHHISQRPFLPGAEAEWIEVRRDKLRGILARALECRAEVYIWNGEHNLAVEAAQEAVAMNPFRESAYRLLMRGHAAAGNSAEALRVYERCRSLISEELGVAPSRQTKSTYAEILKTL